MNNSQVAHLWANQSKPRGSGSNFFFEGDTIYSYGRHFPIARLYPDKRAVLFTTKSYSMTTAQHKGRVRRAIPPKYQVIEVPDVWAKRPEEHAGNLAEIKNQIDGLIPKFYRAVKYPDSYKEQIDNLTATYNTYRATFYRKARPISVNLDGPKAKKQFALIEAERKEKAQNKRNKAKLCAGLVDGWVNAWRTCAERPELPAGITSFDLNDAAERKYPGQLLRVKGDTIETSKGASFPISHARHAWAMIKACHDNKKPFEPNGHTLHVGNFAVDKIDENGDTWAGCHFIRYQEAELMAQKLGF